jgi:hypothetical protein
MSAIVSYLVGSNTMSPANQILSYPTSDTSCHVLLTRHVVWFYQIQLVTTNNYNTLNNLYTLQMPQYFVPIIWFWVIFFKVEVLVSNIFVVCILLRKYVLETFKYINL